jgi:hypothetical protein
MKKLAFALGLMPLSACATIQPCARLGSTNDLHQIGIRFSQAEATSRWSQCPTAVANDYFSTPFPYQEPFPGAN